MAFALITSGMVTSVGYTAGSSCAAIRCRMSHLSATRFGDPAGGWVQAAWVPAVSTWGVQRLLDLLVPAVSEALAPLRDGDPAAIVVLVAVAEPQRAGRVTAVDDLLPALEQRLSRRFHPASSVIPQGTLSGVAALTRARQAIDDHGAFCVLLAGVDSLVVADTVHQRLADRSLRTTDHPAGTLLGEAAAVVGLSAPATTLADGVLCLGWHIAVATAGDQQAQVQACVDAIRGACIAAGITPDDLAGQYGNLQGREAVVALAWQRLLRRSKAHFTSHAVDESLGDIGAAWFPSVAALMFAAHQRRYNAGEFVVVHLGDADGSTAAAVFRFANSAGA